MNEDSDQPRKTANATPTVALCMTKKTKTLNVKMHKRKESHNVEAVVGMLSVPVSWEEESCSMNQGRVQASR